MFIFDNSNFPIVYLKLSREPQNDYELDKLFEEWYKFYSYKINMIFIVDITHLKSLQMKYLNKLVHFGKKIKELPPYIACTIWYIKSSFITNMFYLAMKMETPICPIILTSYAHVIKDFLIDNIQFINVNDYFINYPVNTDLYDVECIFKDINKQVPIDERKALPIC